MNKNYFVHLIKSTQYVKELFVHFRVFFNPKIEPNQIKNQHLSV
jgi:hypothetical protein